MRSKPPHSPHVKANLRPEYQGHLYESCEVASKIHCSSVAKMRAKDVLQGMDTCNEIHGTLSAAYDKSVREAMSRYA